MRYFGFLAVCVFSGSLACSGNSPIQTGPSPRGDVVVTEPGTVVTTGSRSTAATLGIPPGHLPEAGSCRLWEPGRPPGQQRRLPAGPCDAVERQVRPGQWLVYRPGENKKIIEVRTYESAGSRGVVLRFIRVFDAVTGALLSESEK
jgi:hypothetical protein